LDTATLPVVTEQGCHCLGWPDPGVKNRRRPPIVPLRASMEN
jgi:hypothetical protein